MKYCYNNYIINIIHRKASTQRIYTRISIQVTVDHAEHQGEVGTWGITKSSQCFWKSCILAEFCLYWYLWAWLLVVVVMFEAYNKSLPLSSVCVCVCVCIAETACVRELKVIFMLVLGRHECVRGKFYININKLVFSKSVSQGWSCRSHLLIRPAFNKCIYGLWLSWKSFCFLCFISLSTNLKLSIDIFIMYKLIKHAMISWPLVVSYFKKTYI